ncbi:MAG: response regulator, partial [Myxococcaceae bacterium]
LALLLNAGGQAMAFGVDALVGNAEIVIHPLGKAVAKSTHLAGAAVLEGGRVGGVLNVAEIIRLARPGVRSVGPQARGKVLVVDDSLTTRMAMKAVLEIAGYGVVPCRDGAEALRTLKQTACQLVVSDVQMPEMDGLDLTQRIKADPALSAIPVILVTSLDSAEDRAAGLKVGADGYLIKREVERGKLLDLVRQLLPGG